ncbi:MAG: hemolysin family protein [Calditrichia bacterium]
MLPDIFIYFFIFVILLLGSAFFSGSETAFFSLTPAQLEAYKKSTRRGARRVGKLMSWPRQLLITIVIGNTMVNISIASLAVILTTKLSHALHFNENVVILIDVVVVTFVILILSEILPKVVAVRNAEKFSVKASLLLSVFHYLFYPITYALARLTRHLQVRIGLSGDKTKLTEEELKTLAEVGEEQGTLHKDEKEMIHSIFEFGETTVKEIMVPRTDMVMVETDTSIQELLNLVKIKLHSRIPVFKDREENIVGILYVKDLLPLISKRRGEKLNLEKIVRPAYFVPEQKKIDELLREFQDEHIHMALVVDEYGGISGLVTLEDIIEEIVGEIQDEYDRELPPYRKIDENTYLIDGRMQLEEINKELGLNLPEADGIETISGLILNLLGALPKEKETVVSGNYRLTVEKVVKNRILKVLVEKIHTPGNGSARYETSL